CWGGCSPSLSCRSRTRPWVSWPCVRRCPRCWACPLPPPPPHGRRGASAKRGLRSAVTARRARRGTTCTALPTPSCAWPPTARCASASARRATPRTA
ncbi:UNVERIFIED_CONTAM: hypothetical protein H355_016628, partial [Colinus virginianus]